ncbi:carbonic anhydrase [uncultured Psychrobacter sp.]|uniref:carbonic anhydrase n=1 Tax=uncultured Psychrobacter sp. TaxID=259303 RepID=UPI00345B3244
MNRHYLTTAIMTVSLIGVTACSNSYQADDMPANTSPVVVASDDSSIDEHASWSYSGSTGPEYWGDVEGASACKIGQEQSPIDITRVTASAMDAPTINYGKSASLSIDDDGHTIVYTPSTAENTININNERFELKQFHYHTPSEHQLGSQKYPAEVHFVHANSDGNLAVVGVMLQQGQPNSVMRTLLDGTQLSSNNNAEYTADNIDLSALIPAMPTFYHYQGSLTTPPCSEQVQWYVTKEPLELAGEQLAIMSQLYEGNNRPIQPQGSRVVEQLSN